MFVYIYVYDIYINGPIYCTYLDSTSICTARIRKHKEPSSPLDYRGPATSQPRCWLHIRRFRTQ